MNASTLFRTRSALVALAAIAGLTFAPSAWAATITATNYDTLDKGSQVAADLSSNFTTNRGVDIGDLVGKVFFNSSSGVYTYAFTLTPGINNISEFNAGYDVDGFNGVAGYSFSQATAAGASNPATAFEVESESDGTIDWHTLWKNDGSRGLDAGESVTFFFQSTIAPGDLDTYNLINSKAGGTENYAPGAAPVIPAPAAFPAGLLLFGALAAARKRHWRIA